MSDDRQKPSTDTPIEQTEGEASIDARAPADRPSITDTAPKGQRRGLLIAVVASAAMVSMAFPPLDWGWLGYMAYAPLFWAVRSARSGRGGFGLGYLFGVLHFAALTPWIGVTVVHWSGTSWGWMAWALLSLIQGLWFGLFGLIAWAVGRRSSGDGRLLLTACSWVAVEWLRTLGSVAMPWGLAGYTQYRSLSLIQISDLVGVYGVSFVLALVNAGLSALPSWASGDRSREARRGRAVLRIGGLHLDIGVLVLPCLFYAGALTYGMLTAGLPWNGAPVVTSLIQPNPGLSDTDLGARLRPLVSAADAVAVSAPSLTVWPESACPGDVVHDPNLRSLFTSFAERTSGYHLVGTAFTDDEGRERNSAALVGPDGTIEGRYDKRQLVPYGEWVPARWLLRPVNALFRVPAQDVAGGGPQKPLEAREMRIGVMICYESIFPSIARDHVRNGANILVSSTNDGWAGRSASPRQHFAMTVFRAIETRRTVCAAALTGLTGIVGPNGSQMIADPYQPAAITELVFLRDGMTPYVRWGDWFVYLCGAIIVYGLFRRPRTD